MLLSFSEPKGRLRLGLMLTLPLFVFVACSSTDTSKPSSVNQDPSTQSPSSDTAEVQNSDVAAPDEDLAAAGKRYLEIVNPVNCANRAHLAFEEAHSLGDGTIDPTVLNELQSLIGEKASARQTAFRQMLDYAWPSKVKSEIDVLAADWAKVAVLQQRLADAYDLGAYNSLAADMKSQPQGQGNPGLIRGLLGLGTAEETDQC